MAIDRITDGSLYRDARIILTGAVGLGLVTTCAPETRTSNFTVQPAPIVENTVVVAEDRLASAELAAYRDILMGQTADFSFDFQLGLTSDEFMTWAVRSFKNSSRIIAREYRNGFKSGKIESSLGLMARFAPSENDRWIDTNFPWANYGHTLSWSQEIEEIDAQGIHREWSLQHIIEAGKINRRWEAVKINGLEYIKVIKEATGQPKELELQYPQLAR